MRSTHILLRECSRISKHAIEVSDIESFKFLEESQSGGPVLTPGDPQGP